MTVDTKEVVTTIAYMIGVRMSALTVSYGECSELIEKLRADRDATTIRYLCKLRTVLMQKFKKTDDLMRYQIKNLYNIEWYDHDNIKQLENGDSPLSKRITVRTSICRISQNSLTKTLISVPICSTTG